MLTETKLFRNRAWRRLIATAIALCLLLSLSSTVALAQLGFDDPQFQRIAALLRNLGLTKQNPTMRNFPLGPQATSVLDMWAWDTEPPTPGDSQRVVDVFLYDSETSAHNIFAAAYNKTLAGDFYNNKGEPFTAAGNLQAIVYTSARATSHLEYPDQNTWYPAGRAYAYFACGNVIATLDYWQSAAQRPNPPNSDQFDAMSRQISEAQKAPAKDFIQKLSQALLVQDACRPVATAPQPASVLGSALACDTSQLQQSGDVMCTAAASNVRSNAKLNYEFTYDGEVPPELVGNILIIRSAQPGLHQVQVVIKDTVNNLTAPTQSQSFTRLAPPVTGSSNTGSPANSNSSNVTPNVFAPLVTGGALAAAIALATLILATIVVRGRRPGQPSDAPSATIVSAPPITLPEVGVRTRPPDLPGQSSGAPIYGKPTTLPGQLVPGRPPDLPGQLGDPLSQTMSAVAGQVVGGPVSTAPAPQDPQQDKKKPSDQPSITASVNVSRSIMTGYAEGDDAKGIQIWGDGVDFVFAGLHVEATAGWSVIPDSVKYVMLVIGGDKTPVDQYALFKEAGCAAYRVPTENREFVVQAPWTKEDTPLTIQARMVTAQVRKGQGQPQPCGPVDSPAKTLTIVGAKPQVFYFGDGGWNSTINADADGSYELNPPVGLTLFGAIYPGGFAVSYADRVDVALGKRNFDTYFTPIQASVAEGADPDLEQQDIGLTCHFHLDDEPMQQIVGGLSIPVTLRLTGGGPAQHTAGNCFDRVQALHYQACRTNLKPDDLTVPVGIALRPSRVAFDRSATIAASQLDRPHFNDVLPALLTDPAPLFTSRLRARLLSHSGNPIPGDLLSAPHCTLDFRYLPRDSSYRPMHPGSGPFSVVVQNVDLQGFCLFADKDYNIHSYYDYDHQDKCWDDDVYEMRYQNSAIDVQLSADGSVQETLRLEVGTQPRGASVCFDYPIFVLTEGTKGDSVPSAARLALASEIQDKYQAPHDVTEAELEALAAGLPPKTILVLGKDHCGIIREDGKVWHFLQAGLGEKRKQTPGFGWFNRDQVHTMEHYAEQDRSPVDFLEAGVYRDSVDGFLRRGSDAHRGMSWQDIHIYKPKT